MPRIPAFLGRFCGARYALPGLMLLACAAFLPSAAAQYPDRPVTIIVPWPPGGTTDLAARTFATHLGKELKTQLVVENRPGATGIVGTAAAAKAPPDGYTLILASAETHAINAFTYDKLPYDPQNDFIPVGAFAINPFALVARADFPAGTTRELVETAGKQPGKFTYSSASQGSASQIVMEIFKGQAGLDIMHVPYQGEAPAVAALMGGQVDLMILPAGRARTLQASGKVKVYAVATNARYSGMPEVPTFKEEGIDGVDITNWFALMAPARTPAQAIKELERAIAAASGEEQTLSQLENIGLRRFPAMAQPEFARFVASERQRWGKTIQQADIRAAQ